MMKTIWIASAPARIHPSVQTVASARRETSEDQHGGAFHDSLRDQVDRGERPLPEVACQPLREEEAGVARREQRADDHRSGESIERGTRLPASRLRSTAVVNRPCAVRK